MSTGTNNNPDTATSESQSAIVWREFRKRPLAVAAGVVILVLIVVSTFAPFLANDRPIWYSGVNRSEYNESRRTIGVVMRDLINKADTSRLHAIPVHVERMGWSLEADKAEELRAMEAEIADLSATANQPDVKAKLREIRTKFRREFDQDNLRLVSQSRSPVIDSLNGLDLAFMLFNVVLLSFPLWRWQLRRMELRSQTISWATFGILAVLPITAGLVMYAFDTESIDQTDYKEGMLAEDSDGTESVMYESIIWPPIRYGLDENNLDKKYVRPLEYSSDGQEGVGRWDHAHYLGTDGLGRDLLCRMIWGGRVSLSVGVVAVSIYVTIGIIIGSIAGYFRGWTDLFVSRIVEIVICFPTFFLILTIIAFLGPSIFNIMIVIGLIGWTGVARLVRGEFLRLGEQEFVLAGRSLGYSSLRIIFRHILPNAMGPVLVSATFGIAGAILTESALSFLGMGITVPKPSWGGILNAGRGAHFAPWITYFPGIAIFVTITAYNLVGETLRDAADPRLRGSR